MDAHTCTQEHSGWHSARAGCCRKGSLSMQPGCKARWRVQHAAGKSFSSSPSPHCPLRAALWTRLTWVPYSQASSKASSGTTQVERDPAQMWSYQQARPHTGKVRSVLLLQTSQRHPFKAVKVVEGKEKGGMEERLCTDCSGIWSWFNEENYSRLLNCCGFLFDWMLVFL